MAGSPAGYRPDMVDTTAGAPTSSAGETPHAPAKLGGLLLAGAVRLIGWARQAPKPLHPRGSVVEGILRRHAAERPSGVAWLDETGDDEVIVRLSRAVGLPSWLPDIHGLAMRLSGDGGRADLLLASTGLGRATRFLLTASRDHTARPLTSLLPYRGPNGPLLIGAVASGESRFELLWAEPTKDWVSFATLELAATSAPDGPVSFDPVLNCLPGLDNYGWVQQLREPSYRTARRGSRPNRV